MCFSTTASFTAGFTLIPIGFFGLFLAGKKDENYYYLAAIPIFFGLQQCVEGLIWWLLNGEQTTTAQSLAYIYLFFAYSFWPLYLASAVYRIEPILFRKQIIRIFMIVGGMGGIITYFILILFAQVFTVQITNQCINYDVHPSSFFNVPLVFPYAFILITPYMLSSLKKMRIISMVSWAALAVTYVQYAYAYVSVWCFFQAVLSVYIIYVVYMLPVMANVDPTARREACV